MILLAISDVVYQALIAAVVTIVIAWIAQRNAAKVAKEVVDVKTDLKLAADKTGERLDAVKENLQESVSKTANKLDDIHTLVNGNMSVQLHLNMVTTARLAEISGDPKDKEVANTAKKAYDEHVENERKTKLLKPATKPQPTGALK